MGRCIGTISNTTDLSDHEVVSHQEWLKARADFLAKEKERGGAWGLSAFALEDGVVHHTYSCHMRGLEEFNVTYQLLDRAPRGRDEDKLPYPQAWIHRRDEYGAASV